MEQYMVVSSTTLCDNPLIKLDSVVEYVVPCWFRDKDDVDEEDDDEEDEDEDELAPPLLGFLVYTILLLNYLQV